MKLFQPLGLPESFHDIYTNARDGILVIDLESDVILSANPAAAAMHGYSISEFVGMKIDIILETKSLSRFDDFALDIFHGIQFDTFAQHVRSDGTLFQVEWRATALERDGRTYGLAFVRDVSSRLKAERSLRNRVKQRANEQATLLEISHAMASTLELQPGLILDHLHTLIKFTQAGLFTLDDSHLVTRAVCGPEEIEKRAPFEIKLNGKKSLDTLFNEHHPILIQDIDSNEPNAIFLRTFFKNGSAALLDGVHSWMWVPLAVKNRIIGGIGIAHSRRNYFNAHHAELAMTIANQAAVTLVNAELYENAQAAAAFQERQRLAQNLHDAVNQSLFSAGLIAEVLPRLWEQEPKDARRSLEDLRRLIRGALAEMRALLAELRPSTLTDSDLGDLLRLQSTAFTGRTNIPVEVKIQGEGNLSADNQVAVYRICQEALTNVAKHAKASQVEINLCYSPASLTLKICDNGCGFSVSEMNPSGHYGLKMMQERADLIGAILTVTSKAEVGTEILIQWGEQEKR